MDRKEFEQQVRWLGRQVAPKPLDLAISHYVVHWKLLDKAAVQSCIQLAGLLDQSFPNTAPTSTATQVVALPPPAAAIGSHLLALKILPQIQEIRQKFFAYFDPPFRGRDEAENWLAEASEKQAFESACQELARATGFPCKEVKRYVLVGLEPYLSHVEVTLQSLAYHTRGQISVDWSFTDKDLRTAAREVRKALGVSRLKGMTKSDQHLLELINQVGPPPPKGSRGHNAYWEQLRLLWNAYKRNRRYPPGKALQTKYKRALDKLSRLMPSLAATPSK